MNSFDQTTDEALLRRYVEQGDRDALGELFRRQADAAYSTAMRICRNATDAEDVVQGAFIKVMQTASDFRGGTAQAVRGWLIRIVIGTAKNRIRGEVRRRQREEFAMEDEDDVVVPEPIGGPEIPPEELAGAVFKALDTLPDHYRMSIWLHHYQGMSLKDAADALGVSEKQLDNDLYKGLKKLRSALAEAGIAAGAASVMAVFPSLPVEPAPASLVGAIAAVLKSGAGAATVAATGQGLGVGLFKLLMIGVVISSVIVGGIMLAQKSREEAPAASLSPQVESEFPEPAGEGVEFEDGKIIFRDDFEKGSGNWQIGVMRTEGRKAEVLNDPADAADCASVEEREVAGGTSKVLSIRASGMPGRVSFAFLARRLIRTALSIEYDYSSKDALCLSNHSVVENGSVEVLKHEAMLNAAQGKWYRYRIEIVYREGRDARRYYEVKEIFDGRIVGHTKCYGDAVKLGCVVEKGDMAMDNYIVREMAPRKKGGGTAVNYRWDFSEPGVPDVFKAVAGTLKYVPGGGPDGKGCLQIDGLVSEIRVDVPVSNFPVVVSWRASTIYGFRETWLSQSYWFPARELAQFSNIGKWRSETFTAGQRQSRWRANVEYCTDSYIDRWSDGSRKDLTFGKPDSAGRVTLVFRAPHQIDDFAIKSITTNELPDVSLYRDVIEKIPPQKRVGFVELPEIKAGTPGAQVYVQFVPYLDNWSSVQAEAIKQASLRQQKP